MFQGASTGGLRPWSRRTVAGLLLAMAGAPQGLAAIAKGKTMTKEVITLEGGPPPACPFSTAVRADGFLFLSGQIAQDAATGSIVPGGVEAQAMLIFNRIAAILRAGGKSFDDVIRVGIYLTDIKDFGAVNRLYTQYFTEPFPARTAIAVAALPLGAAIEIDLVAR